MLWWEKEIGLGMRCSLMSALINAMADVNPGQSEDFMEWKRKEVKAGKSSRQGDS